MSNLVTDAAAYWRITLVLTLTHVYCIILEPSLILLITDFCHARNIDKVNLSVELGDTGTNVIRIH